MPRKNTRRISTNREAKSTGQYFEAQGLKQETEKAIALETRQNELVWLPKSQIDCLIDQETGRVYLYIKDWLVEKKEGLVKLKK